MDSPARPASEPIETESPRIAERPAEDLLGRVFVVAGGCLALYLAAWLRLFPAAFSFSATTAVVVLSILLFGFGLGAGPFAARLHGSDGTSAVELFARLQLGAALAAGLSPWPIALLGAPGPLGRWIVLPFVAALTVGAVAFLLGAALAGGFDVAGPRRDAVDRFRRLLVGAALGLLVAGRLFGLVGVEHGLWLAVLVHLLVAMMVRGRARELEPAGISRPSRDASAGRRSAGRRSAGRRWAGPAAILSGALFAAVAVAWFRLLPPILGGSSRATALVAAILLLGLALGTALHERGGERAASPATLLALTFALDGLLLIVPFAAGGLVALSAAVVRPLWVTGPAGSLVATALPAAWVVLPAAVLWGFRVAILGRIASPERVFFGLGAGATFGLGTSALLLLPALGAPELWRGVALVTTVVGLGTAATSRLVPAGRPLAAATAVTAIAVGALAGAPGPGALWRHGGIGDGRVDFKLGSPLDLRSTKSALTRGILAEADGVDRSAARFRDDRGSTWIVDGVRLPVAEEDPAVAALVATALQHPATLRRVLALVDAPDNVLEAASDLPGIEHLEVVSPGPLPGGPGEETTTAGGGADVDGGKTEIVVRFADTRSPLRRGDAAYDLVLAPPFSPRWSQHLTRDFYAAARERLATGGRVVQPLEADLGTEVLQGIYATVTAVFPVVETWSSVDGRLWLVAGTEPFPQRPEQVASRLGKPAWQRAALRFRAVDAGSAYAGFVAGPRTARHLAEASPTAVAGDDRPVLELALGRPSARLDTTRLLDQLRRLAARLRDDRPLGVSKDVFPGDPEDASSPLDAREAWRRGDLEAAAEALPRAEDGTPLPPETLADRLVQAELAITVDPAETADPFAGLRPAAPVEAAILDARRAWTRGRLGDTVAGLGQAFELLRRVPPVEPPMVERLFELTADVAALDPRVGRRLFDLLEEPLHRLVFEETRLLTRYRLSAGLELGEVCLEIFRPFGDHPRWERGFLEARLHCFEAFGDRDERRSAADDLSRLRRHSPPAFRPSSPGATP